MEKISVSDLSVGDYVRVKMCKWDYDDPDTLDAKVLSIEGDSVGVGYDNGGIVMSAFVDDLQPIPITAEVLEKNGWKKSEIDKTMILEICKGQNIGISNTVYGHNFIAVYCALGQCYEVSNMPIRYVHELQHCLRILRTEKAIVL